MDLVQHQKLAQSKRKDNKKFFEQLKQKRYSNLDVVVHNLHNETFKKVDCLTCANCCKTTGPLFIKRDIKQLSKHLKISEQAFIDKYLRIDEDGDYVLKTVPCPFLGENNYCGVYDYRPNACREYPHTNQPKIHTIFNETLENISVCPAVYQIVERLKQYYSTS
ncbi:MAG: YkgJ family cysteine cluster protein [Bacteroidetes bacterium]|nr:MAG: YkgJ family cysteine cluster protein [Bacteroidota bacterium]